MKVLICIYMAAIFIIMQEVSVCSAAPSASAGTVPSIPLKVDDIIGLFQRHAELSSAFEWGLARRLADEKAYTVLFAEVFRLKDQIYDLEKDCKTQDTYRSVHISSDFLDLKIPSENRGLGLLSSRRRFDCLEIHAMSKLGVSDFRSEGGKLAHIVALGLASHRLKTMIENPSLSSFHPIFIKPSDQRHTIFEVEVSPLRR